MIVSIKQLAKENFIPIGKLVSFCARFSNDVFEQFDNQLHTSTLFVNKILESYKKYVGEEIYLAERQVIINEDVAQLSGKYDQLSYLQSIGEEKNQGLFNELQSKIDELEDARIMASYNPNPELAWYEKIVS